MKSKSLILLISILIFSCSTDKNINEQGDNNRSLFEEILTPAGNNTSLPNLFVDSNGKVYMSWVEKSENTSKLYYADYNSEKWGEAKLISQGDNWFVNWADFPAITTSGNGSMLAHFLAKSAPDTYAYDVNLVLSSDNGESWGQPFVLHNDSTQSEHGFVTMLPMSDENFFITWLDGRNTVEEKGAMTIRGGIIDKSGNILETTELDQRVCDCCQTGAALTSNGPVVVYRDRSDEEVRDISIVRWVDGQWTDPQSIHPDGWKIAGCPVNGPKVDAIGSSLAVAWYSGAKGESKVNIAFSKDGGETFSQPIRVDDGATIGRIDLVIVAEDEAWVTWLESAETNTEIRARSIRSNGELGPSIIIAATKKDRSSGFPQIVKLDNQLIIAFTEVGTSQQVKAGIVKI